MLIRNVGHNISSSKEEEEDKEEKKRVIGWMD